MIKKWIIKLFKINTYEEEYQDALTDIEVIISVAKNYKRELEGLKDICDDLIKTSEDTLATAEDALAIVNDPDRKREYYEHRAYANGRQSAYAEMGIKALDARAKGKTLYVDHDIGDLIEGNDNEKLDRE